MNAIHEDFGRETRRAGPSDRNFGLIFTAVFLLFALSPVSHGRPVRFEFLTLSMVVFVIAFARPTLLHRANRIWRQAGILLGKVVNPIVTALLLYLVFTPFGVVRRWMGKDSLRLKREPEAQTYWIERSADDPVSNMHNQY